MGHRTKKRLVLFVLISIVATLETLLAVRMMTWHADEVAKIFQAEYATAMFMVGFGSWLVIAMYYWIERYEHLKMFFVVLAVIIAIMLSAMKVIVPFWVGAGLNALLWMIFFLKFFVMLLFDSRGDWKK